MKYKLIEKSTGSIVTYGDEKLQFGGPWGQVDKDGNPLYVWQEHVETAAEAAEKANAVIKTQIIALEDGQHRAIREYALTQSDTAKKKLAEIDAQIAVLRNRLI